MQPFQPEWCLNQTLFMPILCLRGKSIYRGTFRRGSRLMCNSPENRMWTFWLELPVNLSSVSTWLGLTCWETSQNIFRWFLAVVEGVTLVSPMLEDILGPQYHSLLENCYPLKYALCSFLAIVAEVSGWGVVGTPPVSYLIFLWYIVSHRPLSCPAVLVKA